MARDADYWIRTLNLVPHPEGGCFSETYRSPDEIPPGVFGERYSGPRACSTAIYFLLREHEISALHRLRSDELWHYHAGGSATITTIASDGTLREQRIGPDPDAGDAFQVAIGAGTWFGAALAEGSTYILVGCTVSPGFAFEDFELGERGVLLERYPQHRRVIERLTLP